ncbi:hypothetical protein B5C34_05585 [Pacificimonas flava]|uniref:DNA repair protein n=2 Tax=Pacificimonas TaxID=1960290 RepID=A0A219B4C2_9SPHN|nr:MULTISPECIES: DUF2959 family protein [Pacificimonas]MBZ6377307.1 DUF2959 domain-containing protein [Pacificimonas aurantium]OWV32983.1 hypothetical protein B5C34_05585 [Pacificimonas flava]
MKALLTGIAIGFLLTACESTPYYRALEVVGIEKRDLLVDRIQDTRSSQEQAQEAFRSAMTVYRETADADLANLEGAYDRFNGAYDQAKDKVRAVESDIDAVKRVADDLFAEWQQELDLYQDAQLRAASQARLDETRRQFAELERTLDETEQRMDPVLFALRDRVLYLKHNLNAAALAQMKGEAARIEGDVDAVVADLDRAIREANAFIASLQRG